MFQFVIKNSKRLFALGIISVLLAGMFLTAPVTAHAKGNTESSKESESLVGTQFTDSRITYEIVYDASDDETGSVKIIGNNLKKKTASLFMPAYVTYQGKDYSISTIGEYAFVNSHLQTIHINSSIRHIEKYAFAMSDLTEISIPYNVYKVAEGAFAMCTSLTKAYIGPDVYDLAQNAFAYCDALTDISVDEENINYCIENGIIYNIKKTKLLSAPAATGEVVIPDSVSSIAEYAFEGNHKITSVVLNDRIKTIPKDAFYDCTELMSIKIPASVTKIKGNPFKYCTKLSDIVIEEGNKKFISKDGMLLSSSGKTLYACPSASGALILPSDIKNVEAYAFCGALNLEKLKIPKNIKKLSKGAFYDCENLKEVYFEKRTNIFTDDVTSEEEKVFGNTAPYLVVSLPYSTKAFSEGSIENSLKKNCLSTVIFINR